MTHHEKTTATRIAELELELKQLRGDDPEYNPDPETIQATVLSSLTQPIFAIQPDLSIAWWGSGMEQLTGHTAEAATGTSATHIIKGLSDAEWGIALRQAHSKGFWQGEVLTAKTHSALNSDASSPSSQATTTPCVMTLRPITYGALNDGASCILQPLQTSVQESQFPKHNHLFLQAMLDNSLAFMFIKGKDKRYIEVNSAYASLLGTQRENIIGKTAHAFFPPDIAKRHEDEDAKIFASAKPNYQEQDVPINGELRTFETAKFPLFDEHGDVYAICFFGIEITEKKLALERLHTQHALVQSVVDNTSSIIHIMGADGKFITVNKELERTLGIPQSQIIGKTYADVLPKHAAQITALNNEVLKTGQPWNDNVLLTSEVMGGEERILAVSKFPLKDMQGNVYAVGTVATNITEFIKHEKELQRANTLFGAALNGISDMVAIKSPEGVYQECNPAFANFIGKSESEIIGCTDEELFSPSEACIMRKQDTTAIESGAPLRLEEALMNSEGKQFLMDTIRTPFFTPDGEPLGTINVSRDITLRHMQESRLRESERRYRALFDNSGDAIFIYKTDGTILDVNASACEQFSCTAGELVSKKPWQLNLDDTKDSFLARMASLKRTGRLFFEGYHALDGGTPVAMETNARLIHYSGEEAVLSTTRNIEARKKSEQALKRSYEAVEQTVAERTKELKATTRSLKREIHERRMAEEALRDNAQRFQALFELAPDAVFLQSESGTILDCNIAAVAMTGYTREALLTMNASQLTVKSPEKIQPADMHGTLYEGINIRQDGTMYPVECCSSSVSISGKPAHLVVLRDITERKDAEQQLQLFVRVFESALEGITITNTDGTIIAVNEAFTTITGYEEDEALGQNPRILKSDRHDDPFYAEMWQSLSEKGHWEGEIWNRRKSGESYPEWLSISSIKNTQNVTTNYVAVFHDITEMKQKEWQIKHQAYHDALTGLPNRQLLKDRLSVAITHARQNESMVAVLFIDLDNFKNINDSLGHVVGDVFLQAVATDLLSLVPSGCTVARLGGDEFVIMIDNFDDERSVVKLAATLIEHFQTPFSIQGHELFATMSIGITIFPDDGQDSDTLIKHADLAMYRAKEQGKNRYRMFTSRMNERVTHRLTMETEIRRGIENEEFILYYQPKVNLRTGKVTGMEALCRWQKQDGSLVSPAQFIPIAEETGLILPLGETLLEQACKATKSLVDDGHTDLRCSVNLSAQQFQQKGLVPAIEEILYRTQLNPANLEIEITETTLMKEIPQTVYKLQLLSDMGITLSVDDFGSGYSSLYYLKHFPIDILKIDQAFIRDIPRDPNDAAIVSTIIAMAEHMNMSVIAEGVETKAQLAFLFVEGCDEVQGYLFSKPLPLEEFTAFIANPPEAILLESE